MRKRYAVKVWNKLYRRYIAQGVTRRTAVVAANAYNDAAAAAGKLSRAKVVCLGRFPSNVSFS